MNKVLKILFFTLIIKPVVLIVLGLNVVNRNKLPLKGPAIIAANHNSHLDTMVLMSLYPLSKLHLLRPVAAADYFLKNRWMSWFSLNVIGIIPLSRRGEIDRKELFAGCHKALDRGEILLLFPEGTRGEPEQISAIKKGLYYLLKERHDTKITPVIMHGLGRALPRGSGLLVPFNCDVVIGDPLAKTNSANEFVSAMAQIYSQLLQYCITRDKEL